MTSCHCTETKKCAFCYAVMARIAQFYGHVTAKKEAA